VSEAPYVLHFNSNPLVIAHNTRYEYQGKKNILVINVDLPRFYSGRNLTL